MTRRGRRRARRRRRADRGSGRRRGQARASRPVTAPRPAGAARPWPSVRAPARSRSETSGDVPRPLHRPRYSRLQLGSRQMRLLRTLLIFKLGAWAGMASAAAFVKRAVPSRGDEDSDELSLVAVFDGIELKSRAKAFKGGSMLASTTRAKSLSCETT